MPDERLEDLLTRLERERADADAQYNAALTALDQAVQRVPEMPHAPPPPDEFQVTPINQAWDTLPAGAPAFDGSLKGRLRAFIWRLAGPPLEQQKAFNAAVVDHINRNLVVQRETERAIATLIEVTRQHIEALVFFQSRMIQYLQTITLYVDTKDRGVAGQAQVLNAGLSALTDDWLKRWESLTTREQRYESLAGAMAKTFEDTRSVAVLAQQTSLTLKREVERLIGTTKNGGTTNTGGTTSVAPDLDAFKYVGFEDAFRGSREEIRRKLEDYLPRFDGCADVLEIGCGRGEFLEMLRARGISSRGLDLNHEMVEVSRASGLDVIEADALEHLTSLPDASLGGLFAAQVVEHLSPDYLYRLIETAFHKLRPGAPMILETINVACWLAFFESYIRDLTHVHPLHPETLQFMVRASGFQRVEIEYRSPVHESARLQRTALPTSAQSSDLADLVATMNDNVVRLNSKLFSYQDYAVLAVR